MLNLGFKDEGSWKKLSDTFYESIGITEPIFQIFEKYENLIMKNPVLLNQAYMSFSTIIRKRKFNLNKIVNVLNTICIRIPK